MTPGVAERTKDGRDYFEGVGVDFVNEEDREEAGILEDEEDEDEADEATEGEMRKMVRGRVGGWVDWAVGWADFRTGDLEDDEDEQDRVAASASATGKKTKKRHELRYEETKDLEDLDKPTRPAPAEEGILGDAKWLLGVAKSIIV